MMLLQDETMGATPIQVKLLCWTCWSASNRNEPVAVNCLYNRAGPDFELGSLLQQKLVRIQDDDRVPMLQVEDMRIDLKGN